MSHAGFGVGYLCIIHVWKRSCHSAGTTVAAVQKHPGSGEIQVRRHGVPAVPATARHDAASAIFEDLGIDGHTPACAAIATWAAIPAVATMHRRISPHDLWRNDHDGSAASATLGHELAVGTAPTANLAVQFQTPVNHQAQSSAMTGRCVIRQRLPRQADELPRDRGATFHFNANRPAQPPAFVGRNHQFLESHSALQDAVKRLGHMRGGDWRFTPRRRAG
ncbi:MAG: hypothetical protein MUE97_01690 [Phycisphaerales bacterium]|nr:hypothetical protein [Phycisphaerales bacterium]